MIQRTCGIYLISADNKLLIGHPTNAPMTIWGIPKGLQNPGESNKTTAGREFFEETGLNIDPSKMIELSPVLYKTGLKKLYPFIFKSQTHSMNIIPKCFSMVYPKDKRIPFPEIDIFKWVTIDEAFLLIHETQKQHLQFIKRNFIES